MTELFPFPLSVSFIQDALLILISGLACLYCIALNRRVKGLSNMKTGLGASIVSLTDAIRQTQTAAQDTEATTLQAIHKLQSLMDEAESTISKLEARKIDLDRLESATYKATQKLQSQTALTIKTIATLDTKNSDLDRNVGRAAKLADLQSKLAQRIKTELPSAIAEVDTLTSRLKEAVHAAKDNEPTPTPLGDLATLESEEVSEILLTTEIIESPAEPETKVKVDADKKDSLPSNLGDLLQLAFGVKSLKTKDTEKASTVTLLKQLKSRDIVRLGALEQIEPVKAAS